MGNTFSKGSREVSEARAFTAQRRAYPRKVEIVRAVEAAKACGLDVAGVEVSPEGVIRIVEARAIPRPKDQFEEWAGRL